jgi:hypothetical protein
MDASPFYNNNLSFRAIDDSMAQYGLDASECCLIHADNPMSAEAGVFLNHDVRLAYSETTYAKVHDSTWRCQFSWLPSWKGVLRLFPVFLSRVGLDRRMRDWQKHYPSSVEAGKHCVCAETQVLAENGWAHIDLRES